LEKALLQTLRREGGGIRVLGDYSLVLFRTASDQRVKKKRFEQVQGGNGKIFGKGKREFSRRSKKLQI